MALLAVAAVILNLSLLILVGSGADATGPAVLWQQAGGLASGVLFLVGFAPPAALRMLWRRREVEAFRSGEADLMRADTEDQVAMIMLPHAIALVGAQAAVLVDEHGEARSRLGLDEPGALAIAARLREPARGAGPVTFPDLVAVPVRSGWLAVATTPATPLFGSEEIGLLGTLAHLAGLALDRVDLFEKERLSRQALADREYQLAEAQHTAQIGSYAWDPTTGQVTWSDEMYRLLGFEPGAVDDHARAFAMRIHPADRPRVIEAWDEARTMGAPSAVEYRIVLPNGDVRWIQGRVQLAVDSASIRHHLVGTIQDVTDRQQTEERLREAVEREQRMVAELRELARVKTDFISTISHELRTPLTSIAGYVELLADGAAGQLAPRQLDVLEVVDRNARRLTALIEDLLTLSRVDSGEFGLSAAPLDVMALLEGVHRAVLPSASSRGADTGIGIPLDEQEHLFSRFFRSSTATDRAIQGTGLGLAIVKTIVEEHGGRIALESAPGVGTTVTFALPLGAAATTRPRAQAEGSLTS